MLVWFGFFCCCFIFVFYSLGLVTFSGLLISSNQINFHLTVKLQGGIWLACSPESRFPGPVHLGVLSRHSLTGGDALLGLTGKATVWRTGPKNEFLESGVNLSFAWNIKQCEGHDGQMGKSRDLQVYWKENKGDDLQMSQQKVPFPQQCKRNIRLLESSWMDSEAYSSKYNLLLKTPMCFLFIVR